MVRQLHPMFTCSLFRLPARILNRKEVVTLSGKSGHWTKIDSDDAICLPETVVHNMCGNTVDGRNPAPVDK